MISPYASTITALLFIRLTSASLLPENRIVFKDVDVHVDAVKDGKVPSSRREKRQDLVGLPSWTSPDCKIPPFFFRRSSFRFCYETGQVRDMASLMVHPPPSKTLDYSSLCSEVLRPTRTISTISTRTGDSVIIITSTATFSTSTTSTDNSHSTTTALCPLPTPSSSLRCAIPALGFSKNILYYRTHLSDIACHELCLKDKACKSFQIVQQNNEDLKYTRCNVYKTQVDGNVSEGSVGEEAMFWDRGCAGVSAPGCAREPQNKKRDEQRECCRLERLPSINPASDFEFNQQESPDEDSALSSLEEIIRVERDEVPESVEVVLPIEVDSGIRVERREDSIDNAKVAVSLDYEDVIRLERNEVADAEEDVESTEDSECIRIEKRTLLLRRSQNRNEIEVETKEEKETSAEAARNGYILLPHSEDDGYRPALLQDSEVIRPKSRDPASRTTSEPQKRYQPAKPKRTPESYSALPYNIPVTEQEEKEEDRIFESASTPENEVIRVEKQKRSVKTASDPLITPAPEFPVQVLIPDFGAGNEKEHGIRVEKRETWTTPDFLRTFFPLFITLACSCLITSAAPVVTSSVTDVVQMWNYTTTTSTKSEVYSFTEHPSWSTVYRTVA
ncbi:hypothetical protein VTL71DRAFT_13966 [Oculimacula yallundae]|uniref:Apple domain-containing protein n=1 Tax=Oculimacula yallundae TaxID=86028 RepID=A0ABR4CLV4_9HELO